MLSWWVGRDEPEVTFLTSEERNGPTTRTQRREIALQMMRTSSQVAQYVAWQAIGRDDAAIVPGDVVVSELVCLEVADDGECARPAPADAVLDPGDKLIAADGTPLETVDDLVAELADNEPGDTVELEIERPGESEPRTVEVELIASPDDPDRTIIGFVPFDTARVVLPVDINFDTGRIGGPSAGLAFTLTLIDEMSPGDLTGGADVAVTGEIALDGTVGAIGGLAQKVSAVRQVGVKHFIVPDRPGRGAAGDGPAGRRRRRRDHPGGHARRGPRRPRTPRRRSPSTGRPVSRRRSIATIRTRCHAYAGADGDLLLAPGSFLAGSGGRRRVRHVAAGLRPAGGPRLPAHGGRRAGPAAGARALPRARAPRRPGGAVGRRHAGDRRGHGDPPARRGDGARPHRGPRGQRGDQGQGRGGRRRGC